MDFNKNFVLRYAHCPTILVGLCGRLKPLPMLLLRVQLLRPCR